MSCWTENEKNMKVTYSHQHIQSLTHTTQIQIQILFPKIGISTAFKMANTLQMRLSMNSCLNFISCILQKNEKSNIQFHCHVF